MTKKNFALAISCLLVALTSTSAVMAQDTVSTEHMHEITETIRAGDVCEAHDRYACDIVIDTLKAEDDIVMSDITDPASDVSIAYVDISCVNDDLIKEAVLAAREEIIYSKTWVADGINGRIIDSDGTVTEVPHFSELFPEDWEIPVMSCSQGEVEVEQVEMNGRATSAEIDIWSCYEGNLRLTNPSSLYDTDPFCTFRTSGSLEPVYDFVVESVYVWGGYHFPSGIGTYNVGFSNNDTGASLGYATRLNSGQGFEIDPPAEITLGVRASTYDTVGNWYFEVDATVLVEEW